jgi:hypothetical protein
VSRLSRQCGILNISQPYRPTKPVTRIALLYFTYSLLPKLVVSFFEVFLYKWCMLFPFPPSMHITVTDTWPHRLYSEQQAVASLSCPMAMFAYECSKYAVVGSDNKNLPRRLFLMVCCYVATLCASGLAAASLECSAGPPGWLAVLVVSFVSLKVLTGLLSLFKSWWHGVQFYKLQKFPPVSVH